MYSRYCKNKKCGFTLIELSVVLLVVAMITAMGAVFGMSALESSRRVATLKRMETIEDALMLFRRKYARLPCPADPTILRTNDNYGIERATSVLQAPGSTTGSTINRWQSAPPCTTISTYGELPPATTPWPIPNGSVPTRTLGLPDEFMYDGWGRKFMYEVSPQMTTRDAFFASYPNDSCSITVQSNAGTSLPINPVYALVSYGSNGIGGFLERGTQITGMAGTNEQINIRDPATTSWTSDPVLRLQSADGGVANSSTYYDDIIRFKNRYQLTDYNDRTMSRYDGPNMAYSYRWDSQDGRTAVDFGRTRCGEYQKMTVSENPLPTGFPPSGIRGISGPTRAIAFINGNRHFMLYASGLGNDMIYSISGNILARMPSGTTDPNKFYTTPIIAGDVRKSKDSNSSVVIDIMKKSSGSVMDVALYSGDMVGGIDNQAVAHSNPALSYAPASPYIRTYRFGQNMPRYMEVANGVSTHSLPFEPTNISISGNGEYMTASGFIDGAGWYKATYIKKDGSYQNIPAFSGETCTSTPATDAGSNPIAHFPGKCYHNAISPNGRYYIATEQYRQNYTTAADGTIQQLFFWRNVNGIFTKIQGGTNGFDDLAAQIDNNRTVCYPNSNLNNSHVAVNACRIPSMVRFNSIRFTADSRYLVLTGESGKNNIIAFYIDPLTDQPRVVYEEQISGTPDSLAISRDGRFMIARAPSTSVVFYIFRKTSVVDGGGNIRTEWVREAASSTFFTLPTDSSDNPVGIVSVALSN